MLGVSRQRATRLRQRPDFLIRCKRCAPGQSGPHSHCGTSRRRRTKIAVRAGRAVSAELNRAGLYKISP